MPEEALALELKEDKEVFAVEADKYLIFSSNRILFGVNTDYVETILTESSVTFIPMLPPHISGVINLRGLIVPIIDFRTLLGQGMAENTCIVVLREGDAYVGIQVDDVDEMVDVSRKQILPVPYQSNQNLQNLVCGMFSLAEGGTMMVLDCQFLFSQQ